jgi:transposase, IS30 family
MKRQRRKLTVEDRVAIDLRRKDGWGVRAIARELGRSPSVISTEIGRGREQDGNYAAGPAQAAAAARRDRSGRRTRLAPDSPLFAEVAKLLRQQWSPEQIAGRRKRMEDGTAVSSGLRVSHEAIYQAIYAVPRGELRRELLACLRQGKPQRGRRSRDGERRGRICNIIRERPAEVEGRLVPGHWEGDLIKGAGNRSSVGTLVERTSRKLVLVKLADAKAETARDGFAAGLLAVPAPLRLTLTYDQGKEMARHRELAALTGLRVYFADPHAPWQRGSNENTNGLLRQYLPKGTDLSMFSQAELDAIAARLNSARRLALRHPMRCSPRWWTRPPTPSRHEMRRVFVMELESAKYFSSTRTGEI